MDTRQINLFVYDTKENFNKSKQFLGEEGSAFKKMICIENIAELDKYFETPLLGEDEFVFIVIHVFAFNKICGIKKYLTSGIPEKYPNFGKMFISDGNVSEIKHLMVDANIPHEPVYKYHEVYSNLRDNKFEVYQKKEILERSKLSSSIFQGHDEDSSNQYPQIKYAVITALYQDEFEELKKVFNFPFKGQIKTDTKIYHRGYLLSNNKIEIVAAVPNATGMVDSSIIATQMLELFKPKYLLMSGVCGGAKDYSFGDIIVAKQVFTFQKGKISDLKRKNAQGENVKIDLFDINQKLVDYNHLYDNEGNQIAISIEKFEIEHDTIIQINTLFEDALNEKLDIIKDKINADIKANSFFKDKDIKIAVKPIACSTMVINREGYFEDTIKSINRNTAAVEMESYGVARACQFANNGKTIPIIFKSVMDTTFNKEDSINSVNVKKFAAYTSAQFMRYLFEENII